MDDDGFFVGADTVDDRGRHYLRYHQEGTENMPRRVLVHLNPTTLLLWRAGLQEWLMGTAHEQVMGIIGEAGIEDFT
jgi:hypothetical protein